MNEIDWIVLVGIQVFIVVYGIWKTRGSQDMKGYVLGNREMKWFTIGISIIATQASAVTFFSTPGQAFGDGMRFIQFYFGLPIAMVVLSIVAIPLYHRLNVYTAYEFLEKRFDLKTRALGALLFLTQRSLAAGLSIYAPAIVLATVLKINFQIINIFVGLLVIAYTVSGGTKAVSVTQKQQMGVILLGMIAAVVVLVFNLPNDISLNDSLTIAGKMGRMNVVDFSFNPDDRYNIWSGILAGTFLFLSYFGTDQSQVQRYLGGQSIGQSRMGLLLNGMVKIPMQFFILFVGVLLFVFYQFEPSPIYFNVNERNQAYASPEANRFKEIESAYAANQQHKQQKLRELLAHQEAGETAQVDQVQHQLLELQAEAEDLRNQATIIIRRDDLDKARREALLNGDDEALEQARIIQQSKSRDGDFVFITFILDYLPHGLIGLLVSVILSAAMSSASSELNSLGTTTTVDIYQRMINKNASDHHYLFVSKAITVFWGVFAIGFSLFADQLENLIQAVNLIGSLVYGTVLGIFLVAFFMKKINGDQVFIAAIIIQSLILFLYIFYPNDISFLWYNPIGGLGVLIISYLIYLIFPKKEKV